MVLYILLIALSILFLYWFKGNGNENRSQVSTTVLKAGINCLTCVDNIEKKLKKVKGVMEVSVDLQEELVTVKGTMDDRELIKILDKMKKAPRIVKKY